MKSGKFFWQSSITYKPKEITMSDKQRVTAALLKAEHDTKAELENSPKEELGCCTIRHGSWSEQKPNVTKQACENQNDGIVKVTWKPGSC
jgi:hypothetical protein